MSTTCTTTVGPGTAGRDGDRPAAAPRALVERSRRVLTLVVAAALVAGCNLGPGDDPRTGADGRLRFLSGSIPSFGFGKEKAPAGEPVAINTATMCASGTEPVQIVSVTLKDPENLTLVDWGVRPYPPDSVDVGTWSGTVLKDRTFSQRPVEAYCKNRDLVELDLSAKRTEVPGGIGVAHGFEVTTTGGTLFVPMLIELCAATCPDDVVTDLP
jgi:hypothetical protein